MKKFNFLESIAIAGTVSFLLISCASAIDRRVEEVLADTAIVKPVEPATGIPGNVMIVQHKVANFAKWKQGYESHDSTRLAYGLHNYIIGKALNDANNVVVILKMDDVNKAKVLTGTQDIKDRMKNEGVIGTPSFEYLEVVMNDTSKIEQATRLMIKHKVKNWDAWKTSFDKNKQARIDAGMIDRGIGYSIGNNQMVTLVFAITDMKKASAFLKSNDLKDKMANAGVDGPPTFFFYNIAQKY
ncbi:MAG: hypothetical protein ABIN01_06485 [Ferruginibacter sp.]